MYPTSDGCVILRAMNIWRALFAGLFASVALVVGAVFYVFRELSKIDLHTSA